MEEQQCCLSLSAEAADAANEAPKIVRMRHTIPPTGLRKDWTTSVRKRRRVVLDKVGLGVPMVVLVATASLLLFALRVLVLLVAILPNAISHWRCLASLFGRNPEPNVKPSFFNTSRSAALKRYGFNKPCESQKSILLKPAMYALNQSFNYNGPT